ncbi:MAG TPA: sulfatase-like hydrolase/transferase [Burkholderiaceae bacterium]|nr:sulfatase-like hydrolase/transferase [Burkholderiaceae bacterium]
MTRKRGSTRQPNLIIVLIDDLRFDEVGFCGHPYMKTPNIDRIGAEGLNFVNAFHTTPLCSPNRASIVTGQYASRHGIIDNVAREGLSHRLDNYHRVLQRLGYVTAHVGKWHMGNSATPRPGYDRWVSFPGHGGIVDPVLNIDGDERQHEGYVTDLLNAHALEFIERKHDRPFSLFLAHKAVHPDAFQAPDGTLTPGEGGYIVAPRHMDLYRGEHFPPRPNVMTVEQALRTKPAFAEAFELRAKPEGRAVMDWIQSGSDEEIRLRAAMMASVDEGVGQIFDSLERQGILEETVLLFLGDNGYFFGEHGLGPERRFAYEEGIRTPFLLRYPRRLGTGERKRMVLALDIAPTMVDLAGGKARDMATMQGSSLTAFADSDRPKGWRRSFMCEYFSENAMPWLHGMTYKAVRTERYKYIHWVQKSPTGSEADELYDLVEDPHEMKNLARSRSHAQTVAKMRKELGRLVTASLGL